MQRLMLRLGDVLGRRRRLVIGLWAVTLLAALPFAARQSEHLTGGGFEARGSQSDEVDALLAREFPATQRATLAVVLVPRPDARAGDVGVALARVQRAAEDVPRISVPAPGVAAAARARPDQPAILALDVAGGETRAIDAGRELRKALGIEGPDPGREADGRIDVHVAGQGALWAAFQQVSSTELATAESRAFPLIALVLLVAFGSLAAAALPLGLGVAAVTVAGAVIYLLSLRLEMSVFVTSMASMIGIGVAVDYSLFVLSRHREEVAGGRSPTEARRTALATSGVAVLFSGLTVMVALAGLFVVGSTALSSLAIGAIVVVAISVLAAATLLPVLIGMLGDRAHEPGRIARGLSRRRRRRPADADFWDRWTGAVMRRPSLAVLLSLALLLTLALPALDLRIGNSGERQLPSDHEFRAGVRAASQTVGPGALGPVQVVAQLDRGTIGERRNATAVARLREAIERDPAVRRVDAPGTSQDGQMVLLTTILDTGQESERAHEAVKRLRGALPAVAGDEIDVQVGGTTASLIDFDDLVSGSMWKLIAFVLGLSFLVLLVLLRSIVLPLKAVVMNVLSVAAAYGVLVAVFQWGWLRFLGLEPAPTIDTITPPLVLVIAFGLSMDYEIFLLSRIRERYMATGDNRRAVAEGLASSARTITSAAVIMVVVFLSFVSAAVPSVQRIGLAAAVAIAVDATIVRLVLVPAAMELLGTWNWWLPRPLGRLLPAANVERIEAGSDTREPIPATGER